MKLLLEFLESGNKPEETLSFKAIENIIGCKLPLNAEYSMDWWDQIFENSNYQVLTVSFASQTVKIGKIC